MVAYGALLPQSALDIPPHGWVNLHFSVLPAWRGAAPVQHAIWAGDEVTGATTFRIVKELDAGPTFGVMTETIRPTTRPATCWPGSPRAAPGCWWPPSTGSRTAPSRPASSRRTGVSFAPKILVEDARIDWSEPAVGGRPPDPRLHAGPRRVDRPSRASGSRSARCTVDAEHPPLAPGVLEVTKNAVLVGTATAPVRLGEVKAFGKKQMAAADWARGVRFAGRRQVRGLTMGRPATPEDVDEIATVAARDRARHSWGDRPT